MGSLDGEVALVTAGSGGIGRGVVNALLMEGASVALTGRSTERGARALEEIGLPDRTVFFAGDARDRDDVA
ncbi:SDR family NAD(P)-dependent oxidoreductase, partial [Gordonia humi]